MSTATAEPVGDLATALAHASRLLRINPALADEQAREILKVQPGETGAKLVLAKLPEAWRAMGDRLALHGDAEAADNAYAQSIHASVTDPTLMRAAAALCDNKLSIAEHTLKPHLKAHPTDVAAIRMLAEVAGRLGRYGDSEKLLRRALELAPSFHAARHNLAMALHRANRSAAALKEIDALLERDPHNDNYRTLQAACLSHLGEYRAAAEAYAAVLARHPSMANVWMSYGHTLKTDGQTDNAIAAYRKAISLRAAHGEAWWSLANLKTFKFSEPDLTAMRAALNQPDLADIDKFHLHYALGKALEDRGHYADSFAHYAEGARLRRLGLDYDADALSDQVRRAKAFYTPALMRARAGQGAPAADPIFIVGLPRSGSTLIEQILSSHSAVEGTMELPDMNRIVQRLGEKRSKSEPLKYPEIIAELSPDQLRALGEEFLETTRIQRKSAKPLFIDKMPNNFQHVGFIQLILPNAKIIDARRHPMATCFSAFKQHFARGQGFSYDFTDLARFYHDYVELMAHFDRVTPGRVHRVIYENLVADTEAEVRRLLAYCGLPFEASCLNFHENDRAVRTASSEQVRQPIYRDGVDHWRHYQTHLGPLQAALGSVLTSYPAAPPDLDC